jgi:hypothetical protein
VLTTIRAVTLGSRWTFRVHFEVLSGNEERYFDFQQGAKVGELIFIVVNLIIYIAVLSLQGCNQCGEVHMQAKWVTL